MKDAWDESIKRNMAIPCFKAGGVSKYCHNLARRLGKSDKYHQQKQIMLTMAHLEREESDALDRQGKYEKMMKSLGFLSGLLLIILLM